MKPLKPENFFTALILIVGLLLVFLTPFGAGTDEDTHLGRIWEISNGALVPNQYLSTGAHYPFAFYQISYRQDVNLTPVTWDAWKEQMSIHIDWDNFITHITRTRYFPTFYLPQAVILGVMGRLLDLPVGIFYYAIRLSYLLTYALLCYLAIRIVPIGKWLMGLVCVLPMSLFGATAITPDAVMNGTAFLFIAWILALNRPERKDTFTRKEWFITVLLVLAVCTLKPNCFPLLLILFLVPRAKLGPKPWLAAFLALTALAVLVVGLGWNILTASELVTTPGADTYSVSEQLKGVLAEPLRFLSALGQTAFLRAPEYLVDLIGESGYGYWPLPALVYWIAPILLLLAVLSDSHKELFTARRRWLILAIFLMVYLGTIILFYLLYNPPGTTLIPGVQGRYFLFILPLLLLALLPGRPRLRLDPRWLQGGALLVSALIVAAMFLVYHLPCGASYYSGGACLLPRYKNFQPEAANPLPLTSSQAVSQTFVAACSDLSRIDLWIRQSSASSGALLVEISDPATGETLASRRVEPDVYPVYGWLPVEFPVIPSADGRTFLLRIAPADAGVTTGPELAYFTRDEYTDGQFTLDNQAQEGDLLFRYGCRVGWEKIFPSAKP